jgi:hypothetical protein
MKNILWKKGFRPNPVTEIPQRNGEAGAARKVILPLRRSECCRPEAALNVSETPMEDPASLVSDPHSEIQTNPDAVPEAAHPSIQRSDESP